MAVAGMTAAENHTVRASLKGPQNEHRVEAAGAGNPNDFYVRGILQPIGAGQVGTGIAAPVAAERNDGGRPFLIYLHIASTSAIICLLENPFKSIAPLLQATVQAPHPWQTAGLT